MALIYICRGLDIKEMTGKMKGQVFVTFPNVDMAKRAYSEVNGYLLHGKPMIIVIHLFVPLL